MTKLIRHPASFRDESGYVYYRGKEIYRTVNKIYRENYDLLHSSGLYKYLADNEMLLPYTEVPLRKVPLASPAVYKILAPKVLPFISYSYEWSYPQLAKAALLTLEIEKTALKFNMSLKDASSYNIQFIGPQPVFIDTLSFEKLNENTPWVAYRQFCRHFLAPLALMKFRDLNLGKLSQIFLQGIDLKLSVRMLPLKSYLNIDLFFHLYLHNLGEKFLSRSSGGISFKKYSLQNRLNTVESLLHSLQKLTPDDQQSIWSGYYQDNNYAPRAFDSKIKIVKRLLNLVKPSLTADLGANTGLFSRLAGRFSQYVISLDNDPQAASLNYRLASREKINNLLTLVADITNPTPSIGWRNKERQNLVSRLSVDTTLVLALVHHLYFSHNLSFDMIAAFLTKITKKIIIEFVPLSDPQVRSMISVRNKSFSDYNRKNFELSFSKYFAIRKHIPINKSSRSVYFMTKKI